MRIAFQGEPGAYSEAAALRFSDHADLLPCESFEAVFAAVAGGKATHGILPVENSIGGSIHRNYDLLLEHDLPIVGEVQLVIAHNLLALPGTSLDQVKRIYSHPQALAQCERFLRSLDGVHVEATYDTAGSAKIVKEQGLKDTAAIASERAAQVFGLDIAEGRDPGLLRQHHPVPGREPHGRAGRRRGQDDRRLLAAERARLPLQGAVGVRPARHRPDQDRVAAHSRPSVGVPSSTWTCPSAATI